MAEYKALAFFGISGLDAYQENSAYLAKHISTQSLSRLYIRSARKKINPSSQQFSPKNLLAWRLWTGIGQGDTAKVSLTLLVAKAVERWTWESLDSSPRSGS